ncbi:phosphoadenosine phosphosulfate reductase family protein [Erythrobacter aureus]|nr:phosphoadenosine phosphosulfate reductase family protein [Erythrobacter aureus]
MTAHAANAILNSLGHPRERRLLIHADLGRAEWRSTPAAIEKQAAQLGLPLAVVRRTAGDMVARWEQRYALGLEQYTELKLGRMRSPWSAASLRFCTAEMKRDVLHRHLRSQYPGETIVSALGIRHAESSARAKTPVSKVDAKLKRADGTNGILWHPSIHISTEDVFAYHREHDLHLHEAYTLHGASRVSCAFCVIASLNDLTVAAGVESNRELFDHLVGMELETGFSFQQGRWLADVAPHLLSGQRIKMLAAAKSYAEKRRELESQIPKNFLKAPTGQKWPWRLPEAEEAAAIASARRFNSDWIGRNLPFLTAHSVTAKFEEMITANKALSEG